MTIIYMHKPEYPHIYAVCVVRRHMLYINSDADDCSIIQLDYAS